MAPTEPPDEGDYVTATGRVLTEFDLAALATEAERGYDPAKIGRRRLRRYYLAFGVQYASEPHSHWPGAHPDGWILIEAPNELTARALALAHFGIYWSGLYDETEWTHWVDKTRFPRGEIARMATSVPIPEDRLIALANAEGR